MVVMILSLPPTPRTNARRLAVLILLKPRSLSSKELVRIIKTSALLFLSGLRKQRSMTTLQVYEAFFANAT